MKSHKNNKEIGRLGEDIAVRFLVKKGFEIIQRNYWKKWGEIDIIAKMANKLHFIEVKSVSCACPSNYSDNLSREMDNYRPEENVHSLKQQRLSRTIQTYLAEKDVSSETEWKIDIITVTLDIKNKTSKVKMLEDVVF